MGPPMDKDGSSQEAIVPGALDSQRVRDHLALILKWPDFVSSPQLGAFLRYVVECKLAGKVEQIKAYTIATEALGRPPDFDPQNDPIVRVQARRLRQTLLLYYANPAADDSIRVNLSAGSYVPDISISPVKNSPSDAPTAAARQIEQAGGQGRLHIASLLAVAALAIAALAVALVLWPKLFAINQPPPAPVSAVTEDNPFGVSEIKVAVVSRERMPSWFSADLFKTGLERSLARFDDYIVIGPQAGISGDENAFRIELEFSGFTFGVEGAAKLVRGEKNEIAWSYRFRVPADVIGNYEFLEPLQTLTSKLAQPYGVLYSQLLAQPVKSPELAGILRAYEYFQNQVVGEIEPTRQCLEDIIQKTPGNQLAHVMLSYMYVELYRNGPPETAQAALDRALVLARHAVALRPESSSGHQVLMDVLAAKGYLDEALQSGRRAVELNSNDTDVLADYGCQLIFLGRYSEGETYAERAAKLNPARPPWHDFCLFVAMNNTGRFDDADAIARRLEKAEGVQPNIAVAIAASRRGDNAASKATITTLESGDLGFARDPRKSLRDQCLADSVSQKLLEDLIHAGFHPTASADL
jgi:tetratricopeptide (TPR) repeat protein